MSFDQLWAPWRIGYITGDKLPASQAQADEPQNWEPGADRRCFLCRDVAASTPAADKANLVVHRSGSSIVVLNRYPYNNGHLLVAPRRHVPHLSQLSSDEHLDLMQLISRLCTLIERLMKPEGFNVGMNLGRAAGAGVPDHLHWHIVPRWAGDTNFMPVLAGVNVIPQSLEALLDLLHQEFAERP